MMMKVLGVAVVMTLAVTTSWAQGMVSGVSRADMEKLLKEMKLEVKDETKTGELPWLTGEGSDGRVLNIFMYECGSKEPSRTDKCSEVALRTLWKNTKNITPKDINAFHLKKVFGRGYVDEENGSVGVEHPMVLTGGVSRKMLKENIEYFFRLTDDFEAIVKP